MADRYTYQLTSNGHFRLIKPDTDQVWDENAGAWGALASVTSANAAITIAVNTAHDAGAINLPSGVGYGDFDVLVYSASTGSDTDVPVEILKVRSRADGKLWNDSAKQFFTN